MNKNKLKVRWFKGRKELVYTYPCGINTKEDNYFIMEDVFNRKFIKEMKERGYDIETLKFEIKVDEKSSIFKNKFPALYKLFMGEKL